MLNILGSYHFHFILTRCTSQLYTCFPQFLISDIRFIRRDCHLLNVCDGGPSWVTPPTNKTLQTRLICKFNRYCFFQIHLSRDMTKPTMWVCSQRRLRSAWASAQSDQSLRCPRDETLGPYLPIESTAKTLIRLGGCPSWSESSLGAHSFCWFCHVAAHLKLHCFKESSCFNSLRLILALLIWATSRENVSSGIFDQIAFKPACLATEAS